MAAALGAGKRQTKLGEVCSHPLECAEGYCDVDMTDTCIAFAAEGEPCPPVCGEGLRCDLSDMTCVALLEDGQACTGALACASRSCSEGRCTALEPTIACGDGS